MVKVALDKYYTSDWLVKKCIDRLGNLSDYDVIVEPSAGNGAFLKAFDKKERRVIAYDIAPEAEGIIESDFLKLKNLPICKKILFIGNPPYGFCNNLVKAFLKHCCLHLSKHIESSTVAFIVPSVIKNELQKPSKTIFVNILNQFELVDFFEIPEEDAFIPKVSFEYKTSFIILKKRSVLSDYKIPSSLDFNNLIAEKFGIQRVSIGKHVAKRGEYSPKFLNLCNEGVFDFILKMKAIHNIKDNPKLFFNKEEFNILCEVRKEKIFSFCSHFYFKSISRDPEDIKIAGEKLSVYNYPSIAYGSLARLHGFSLVALYDLYKNN